MVKERRKDGGKGTIRIRESWRDGGKMVHAARRTRTEGIGAKTGGQHGYVTGRVLCWILIH